MNYSKIYNDLIEKRKNNCAEGYVERHHIIPRCMGGTDDRENIVALTAEEHFIAHLLLMKIHPSEDKLALAIALMVRRKTHKKNKMYGWLRKRFALAQSKLASSRENNTKGTIWVTENNKSKRIKLAEFNSSIHVLGRCDSDKETFRKNNNFVAMHSAESRQKAMDGIKAAHKAGKFSEAPKKIGAKIKGRKASLKEIEKNRLSHTGKTASEETKKKMSLAKLGKPKSDETKKKMSIAAKIRMEKRKQSSKDIG